MNGPKRKVDAFFKVISPFNSTEKLKIPTALHIQIQGARLKSVLLRDRYKNIWPVKLTRIGDDWYFENGWVKFLDDNFVEIWDFIVFEHKGDDLFDFKLFGQNACEKKGVGGGGLTCRVKEEQIDTEDEEFNDIAEYIEIEANISKNSKSRSFGARPGTGRRGGVRTVNYSVKQEEEEDGSGNQDDSENLDDSDYNDDNEDCINISKKIKSQFALKSSNTVSYRNSREGKTFGVQTIPNRRVYKRKSVPDYYGADIFKSGIATRPRNPFFITNSILRPRRKNDLYIPKEVIFDYRLNIPERIELVDKQGRKFQTKIKQWKDGRLWCNKGWGSLCKVNGIDKDDTCICEFVQGESTKHLHIQVSVVTGLHR